MNSKQLYFSNTVLVLVLLCASLLAGCNLYEGIYEEGETEDPTSLIEDARLAIQRNEPVQAVAYLRKAINLTSEGEVLRTRAEIKLATALLATEKIDVLMLRRVAQNFDVIGSQNALAASKSSATLSCKFPDTHPRTEFDPVAGIDYARLEAAPSQEVINESQALLNRVFALNETEANPVFPCDDATAVDARIAELQEDGLTNEAIAEALVDFAVVQSTIVLQEFQTVGGEDVQFFYVSPSAGADDYVSICLPDEATCIAGTNKINEQLGNVQCSALVLSSRAFLLGSEQAQDLANLVDYWRGELEGGIDEPCRNVSGF